MWTQWDAMAQLLPTSKPPWHATEGHRHGAQLSTEGAPLLTWFTQEGTAANAAGGVPVVDVLAVKLATLRTTADVLEQLLMSERDSCTPLNKR